MGRKIKPLLLAGGAGFVGANLVRHLLAAGQRIVCVDNLSTGLAENVTEFLDGSDFSFIRADITNPALKDLLPSREFGAVIDLACPTGVPNIATMGEEMLMASSVGTLNLLKIAEASGARFVFASTAEAYGDPLIVPQSEEYVGNVDPVGPRSPYEEGKRFGEALTALYARQGRVDTRIIRIFNTYGPGMALHDQRVVPQMLQSVIGGKPVTIYGDGSQTRTFLHVQDLITGMISVLDKGSSGKVYNIGGERETTILELFELIRSVSGVSARPVFQTHFIQDHDRRRPDTGRVRELGWRPRIDLREGIGECLAEMRLRMNVPSHGAGRQAGTPRVTA